MKEKSIKNIRQEFKEQGVFYTPKALAEKLKSYIDTEYKSVYDPTCGAGNLLSIFPDNVKKYGQELDEERTKTVTTEEIAENNYTLSVSSYLPEETHKEPIDIDAVNKEVVDSLLKHVKTTLGNLRELESAFPDDNFYTKELIDGLSQLLKEDGNGFL